MKHSKCAPEVHVVARRRLALAIPNPDLWVYRERTIAMLKRYFRLAVETGRLPSVLGREFFRTRVTSEKGYTFENAVIFVHDVERCLEELDGFSRELLGWHVLQDFSLNETAQLMGCGQSVVYRGFLEALDKLTNMFLRHRLMRTTATEEAAWEEEPCAT
jgi:DNA-directed RNA polymerase specialized sigma24 family protein